METMALEREIAAYERDLPKLLADFDGKFVVYHEDVRLGSYDTFQNAAQAAIAAFGTGPYLIRQVQKDAPVLPLPSSVAYRPVHATA